MRNRSSNLASHKGFTSTGRLMVEQDAVAGMKSIRFPVVDRNPVGKKFGAAVGTAWIKRRFFGLGHLLHQTEHLAGRGLVESRLDSGFPNRFQKANRASARHIGSIFRAV